MRYITSIIVLVLLVSNSFSQVRTSGKQKKEWAFQMGPTIGIIDGRTLSPTIYGLIIQPKYIFGQLGRENSVCIGMPLTAVMFKQKLGADSVVNGGYSVNLPIVMDFNFYHGAFKRPKRRLGAFLGAGWNFNIMSFTTARYPGDDTRDVDANYSGLNHGPYFNGGVRIGIAKGASIDIRGYGTMSLSNPSLMVAGVAILYNFGN